MKRESSRDEKFWSGLLPARGTKMSGPSAAYRQCYSHYKLGKYNCLYLDKQMSSDYESGYKQAEADEKAGKEWQY
jgi:hypothetical protein